jgi:hypothetical protein
MKTESPRTGRPRNPNITDAVIADAIESVANGVSLVSYCNKNGLCKGTILHRIDQSQELIDRYARAREELVEHLVGELDDIAKEHADNPAIAKLLCDIRKWIASKLMPKKYGDRVEQEVSVRAKSVKEMTDDELNAIIAAAEGKRTP